MKFDITVDTVGRKWLQVSVLANTGRYYKAQILKEQLPEVKQGESITLFGTCECQSDRYKTTRTITVQPEEQAKAADNEKACVRKQADINKWWGYIQNSANKDGYFYQKGVDKLHELGDTSHDEEIRQIKERCAQIETKKEIDRWWGYVKDTAAKDGKLYQKGMDKLHSYGDHTHDSEVESILQSYKNTHTPAKRLSLNNAYHNLRTGDVLIYAFQSGKTICLKILNARYNRYDGLSFGVNTEEWWDVEYEDISETTEGQARLAQNKLKCEAQVQYNEAEKALKVSLRILTRKIENYGIFQQGDIRLIDIKGICLYDSFSVYGGGLQIIEDADSVWYIQNNGADGDDWSNNHIQTGGAGAYGYCVPKSKVLTELSDWKAKQTEFNALQKVST